VTLANGLGIRVLESGPPGGTPLLLLHGWAISAYLWRHNFAALAAAGYRVHAPDLPGHGLSDAPLEKGSYTLGALTDDVAALLDALGLERTAVVAQSMGGRIALELARRHRVTKLALFGPVGFGDVSPARDLVPFLPAIPGSLAALLVPRELVELVQRRVYGKIGWFTDRDVDEYWAPTQFPAVRVRLAAPPARYARADFDPDAGRVRHARRHREAGERGTAREGTAARPPRVDRGRGARRHGRSAGGGRPPAAGIPRRVARSPGTD
jgi:pimeloyl-ACP methyl ester carboxylesterase